jgi:hypothetical protein
MIAINSLRQIEHALPDAFLHRYPYSGDVRMVGILFARPDSPLAESDIIPSLRFFHQLSDNHIDFFCAGYGVESRWDDEPDLQEVVRIDGVLWKFSNRAFLGVCTEFENRTRLKYSGGVDLVLTNARFDRQAERAQLDFGTTVFCQLDQMKKDGAFPSIEQFFMAIVRFSSQAKNDDPTWGFSDQQGLRVAASALKRVILSLLPKKLANDYNKARHFVVVDANPA